MSNNNLRPEEVLSPEELEKVAGGVIFNAQNIIGADGQHPWEVLDNQNGNVLGRFTNRDDAVNYAKGFGSSKLNVLEIDWNQVLDLRS